MTPQETTTSLFNYLGQLFNPAAQQTRFDTYQAKESINFAIKAITQIEKLQLLKDKAVNLNMPEEKAFAEEEIKKLAGDVNRHLENAKKPFNKYITA